jgi:hypothetical protein
VAAQVHLLTMSQAVRPALMERPAVENCGQGGRRQAERGGGRTIGCEAGSSGRAAQGTGKRLFWVAASLQDVIVGTPTGHTY